MCIRDRSLTPDPLGALSLTQDLNGSSSIPFGNIAYPDYGEDYETAALTDEIEDLIDHQLNLITAIVSTVSPNSNLQSGSFYRPQTLVEPRQQFRRNIVCSYCQKLGHIFRYCKQLQRDYPDGQFPPHVAQLIFRELMSGKGRVQFERKARPPDDGRWGRPPSGVRSNQAPGPSTDTLLIEDSGNV